MCSTAAAFHCRRDRQIQIDAAEHLEAGHLFADHVREPRVGS